MTSKESCAVALGLAVGVLLASTPTIAEEINLDDGHQCCRAPHPGMLVVPADQFVGRAAAGYAAAKTIPEICCKLFCYCGCDQADGHTSLLECFITDHSNSCAICQDEAIEALRLKKEGKSLAQIQQWIDQHFQNRYFYRQPSKTLQDYRARRLTKPVKF